MTHVDRLIVGVEKATAGRTAATLDRLAADGTLAAEHRVALAADEALGSLERLLRTAELAGHDPATVLADAVAARDLDDARHPAQVLHARITSALRGQLTPQVTGAADLIPVEVPDLDRVWLEQRAAGQIPRGGDLIGERDQLRDVRLAEACVLSSHYPLHRVGSGAHLGAPAGSRCRYSVARLTPTISAICAMVCSLPS